MKMLPLICVGRMRSGIALSVLPSLMILSVATVALADTATPDDIQNVYRLAEPAIVQLTVSGKRDGADVKGRDGVACAFHTASGVRLMTAKHVVGSDEEYDLAPGRLDLRQRNISVRVETRFGLGTSDQTVHTIRAHPSMDVAEVFALGEESSKGLFVSTKSIQSNERLIVLTWPKGRQRPIPTEVRVLPREADDGALVRLDKEFIQGDSGSPVLDYRGALVAVVVSRSHIGQSSGTALAIPVAEFKDWLSPGYTEVEGDAAIQKRRELAKMFEAIIVKMRESQIANDETVFPAIKAYKVEQTQAKWNAVLDAVRMSLESIEDGVRLSIQYDAQIVPAAQGVSDAVATTRSQIVDRPYTRTFTDAREVWNGRFLEKKEILRQQNRLPTVDEVSIWESDLKKSYLQLSVLIEKVGQQLVAQQ